MTSSNVLSDPQPNYLEFTVIAERKPLRKYSDLNNWSQKTEKKYTTVAASRLVLVELMILKISFLFY